MRRNIECLRVVGAVAVVVYWTSIVTIGFRYCCNAQTFSLNIRLSVLLMALTTAWALTREDNLTLDKKDPSTHELLSSLGLKKLRIPAAHHRKRFSEQGRRHATGDSRMYVIKLPPNTSYYTRPEPAPAAARTLPLQMTGNGKPARVYYWNIPVLQKFAKNRPQARFDDDVVDVESTPTWPKGINNHPNSLDALAYYVPAKKTSFRKYFSGNGKPKSFYVLDKNKKAAEYHKLLPLSVLLMALTTAWALTREDNLTLDKKDPSTHELLSSLGLKKLRIPAAHHRKRFSEQGRRHATGDSRMYVIKLPPNTSYYTRPEPAPAAARTLPLQMTGNGKPARVYHWNIPVLQKFAKNRPQARFDDDVVDVESTPTWPKGINNHPNSLDALAYYVPAKKTSFRKYFSGNGKPKSFYVLDNNKKAAKYHKLLP